MFGIVYPILLIFQVSLPSNVLSTALILVFLKNVMVNNIVSLCIDF